jgi:hypothetical protein
MSAMGDPARRFRPLYKPMNLLAEKGVFRFAQWPELMDGRMNAGLREKISFPSR